jgi:predicted small metal-binding protein
MTLKLRCQDYGFECDFILEGLKTTGLLEKLRKHFEEEHGIDYTTEVITQMILNRGHSLDSIRKE